MSEEQLPKELKKQIGQLLEEARDDFRLFETNKKVRLLKLAKDMEDTGYPKDMICATICKAISGEGISRDTIERTLPDEYKKKKIRNLTQSDVDNDLEHLSYKQEEDLQRIRPKVLERDGHKCIECGETKDLTIHHKKKTLGLGIDHSIDNLQTLCRKCHAKLHSREKVLEISTNGNPLWSKPEPEPEPERKLSPIETLAAVKAGAEPTIPITDDRDKDLEIGRLKEQLKERDETIKDLSKSVNAAIETKEKSSKTPQPAKETMEYKALLSEKNILQDRIDELEALVKKDPTLGFQSATVVAAAATAISSTTIPNEVEIAGRELSTMFLDSRSGCNIMYFKIEGNKVVGWETDIAREKKKKHGS